MILVGALLLVVWGAFAFGAVYPWAYTPLAVGCALVGVLGLTLGDRPVWPDNRLLVAAIGGIFLVGLVQLVPLPRPLLERVSPGTSLYLTQFDFGWSRAVDPTTGIVTTQSHPISLAPALTVTALLLQTSLVLFLCGLLRSLSRTSAGRLCNGLVFIGFALAVFGIAQKALLGDNAFDGMRIYGVWKPEDILSTPFGPYVNKNHFAGWMLMTIPVTLGLAAAQMQRLTRPLRNFRDVLLWLSAPDGGRMMLYLVVALVMTLSLLMTGSRSGTGCLALLLVGATLAAGRFLSGRAMLAAGGATLLVFMLGLGWAGRDARLERFVSDNESIAMRLDIWRMSARIVREFPVFGSGLDTFGTASMAFQAPGRDLHYNEAHNDYIQLLVEGGILTFLLLLVALASLVRAAAARLRSRDDGVELHWIRVGAVAGLSLAGIQALVEFSLQMPGNAALFVVLLALALFRPAQLRTHP